MKDFKLGDFTLPKFWVKLILIGIPVLFFVFSFISFNNNEVDLRNAFEQKIDERTGFYDKMWKTLKGKSQVAVKNDSSFQNVVNIQMNGQKDGEQVTWKWIQQSNPSASFSEVSKLYADLSRTIEAERNGFFEREKELQRIQREHKNLLQKFPGNIAAMILGKKPLKYKVITSDKTDDVIQTGKDNDTNVF